MQECACVCSTSVDLKCLIALGGKSCRVPLYQGKKTSLLISVNLNVNRKQTNQKNTIYRDIITIADELLWWWWWWLVNRTCCGFKLPIRNFSTHFSLEIRNFELPFFFILLVVGHHIWALFFFHFANGIAPIFVLLLMCFWILLMLSWISNW